MSSESTYNGTVVVIPTRNRAPLAKNAIRSVLEQEVANVHVLVSDNSVDETQKDDLARFIASIDDPRLRYVRPPQSLSMTAHWQWVIQEALSSYEASHFLYLTDRMMFRPRGLEEVLDRVSVYSNKVISYNHDRILDEHLPIRIEQYPNTGKLLELKTLRLSYLYSRGIFPHCFPRMLNCVVPRSLLVRIQERWGNVFDSVAPDFNFCCRCLEMEDSILYYDKAPIFHYAIDRSNGFSEARGKLTPDYRDFTAQITAQGVIRNSATPIPKLATVINAVYQEYIALKEETNSPRFFDIDLQRYLEVNAQDLELMVDPDLKAEMKALLEQHGFSEKKESPSSSTAVPTTWRQLLSGQRTKTGWLFLARYFGIRPPPANGFVFNNVEDAINYVKKFPMPSLKDWPWQEELLEAEALPFTSQR